MSTYKIGLINIGSDQKIQEGIKSILNDFDLNIELTSLDLKNEIPRDVSGVFFVLSKFHIFKSEELEHIKEYLINGNRIVFLLGFESIEFMDTTFFSLLKWLGITVRPEKITDGTEITIKIFREHFITRNLNVIRLISPLSFLTSPENLIIAATSFDERVPNAPVIIYGKKNRGDFIVLGSQKILEKEFQDKQINRLLLNITCWLIDNEECIQQLEKQDELSQIREPVQIIEEKEKVEVAKVSIKDRESLPKKTATNQVTVVNKKIEYEIPSQILDELTEKLKSVEELHSKVDELKESLNELVSLLKKLEATQTKIVTSIERLLSELSNLEIDLLEAMRDDIGAVSQLISKVDAMEKKLDRKLDKILEKLM